jgi:PPOX class probable F420-dependent enzyme
MKNFPEEFNDLIDPETRALGILGTLMADGSPQVTPVWFDVEGETFRINTARGRTKDRNMSARPQVVLTILDPNDPYRFLQVRGKIVRSSEEGAREHINQLSQSYMGKALFPGTDGQIRVIYYLQPENL